MGPTLFVPFAPHFIVFGYRPDGRLLARSTVVPFPPPLPGVALSHTRIFHYSPSLLSTLTTLCPPDVADMNVSYMGLYCHLSRKEI